jgi:hypothetical protein
MTNKTEIIKQYLAQIGRKGGKSISEAKAEAARKNGAKGGRPRKHNHDTKKGGRK